MTRIFQTRPAMNKKLKTRIWQEITTFLQQQIQDANPNLFSYVKKIYFLLRAPLDRVRFQDIWYLCFHKGYSRSYVYSSIIISPPVALILKPVKLQNLSAFPAASCAYQATQSHLLFSRQYWSYYLLPHLFNCRQSLQFWLVSLFSGRCEIPHSDSLLSDACWYKQL
jgi:hypothetical protein